MKWKLEFTDDQKNILFGYMNECNKVYNHCVDLYNKQPDLFKKPYTEIKVGIFNTIYGSGNKNAPYDTLTDEIRIFCSNLKSCLSNLENGHIKGFKMSHAQNTKTKSILISKKAVKLNGILPNMLKKNNLEALEDISDYLKKNTRYH